MLRVGIVGAGRVVAGRYAEVFAKELKNAKAVMICDLVPERAEKMAALMGSKVVDSYDDILSSPDVDAVLVCTESGNHTEHTRQAIMAGKHVIVEKPPAMLPGEVLEMEALAREKGVMYAPVFQNRLNPAVVKLKETVDSGRFGKIVLATIRLRWCRYQDYYEDGWHGTWKMDGGVINQQAIHHVDALEWICGPVAKICAAQANALNKLEAEDTTTAVVQLESGAMGVIEATTAARPEDFEASISVVGEKGMAVIGGIALNRIDTWTFVEKDPEDDAVPEKYSQDVPTGYGLSHGPLMQDIVDRLAAGNPEPPISPASAAKTVSLVHAIYRSVETNGWTSPGDAVSERLGKG
ncbi:Gfo/Idh/MocA family protein [Desulfatibacillum aliphaticivorans]|uniref:Oxidoreductase domain protein n=1 Tax=Desulfatibacillum aliphaticivorans TaxID=218208 RepID=B8FAS6_DESAL|nr:Gfo/Idh/MocA family oxidoreductase [Desulfatibacillum aliphaticivorans]ACL03372.1 oxidoreductase domain protein [Desulfatibacillum aliphaticivorans]